MYNNSLKHLLISLITIGIVLHKSKNFPKYLWSIHHQQDLPFIRFQFNLLPLNRLNRPNIIGIFPLSLFINVITLINSVNSKAFLTSFKNDRLKWNQFEIQAGYDKIFSSFHISRWHTDEKLLQEKLIASEDLRLTR